jgi:site-specific recombinase XerD
MHSVSVPKVQSLLGHGSLQMTMRYAHLAPGTGARLVNLLEGPAPTSESVPTSAAVAS